MTEHVTQPRIDVAVPQLFTLIEDERDLSLVPMAAVLGDVIAVSVQSVDSANPVLDKALALGATRAVQVSHAVFASVDYLALAHALASTIRHLGGARDGAPAIVLVGDRGRGAVGPAVAERLAVPHLGAVCAVELSRDQLLIDRQCGSSIQRLRGAPPAVLACVLPSSASVELAPSDKRVEILGLEAIEVTLPELTYRRRFRPQPGEAPLARARVLPNVERLGERLARDGVWPFRRTGA